MEYILKNADQLSNGVHILPPELDQEIARIKLDAMGINIDSLTEQQTKYLASWEEGT